MALKLLPHDDHLALVNTFPGTVVSVIVEVEGGARVDHQLRNKVSYLYLTTRVTHSDRCSFTELGFIR